MAHRFRPKGSYKDYLNLTSDDLAALTTEQLKGIVSKLNDVANKKMKRLAGSPFSEISPAYNANRGKPFTSPEKGKNLSRKDIKADYLRARAFINAETSTAEGSKKFAEGFGDKLKDRIYDKRFKKPTLKKSARSYLKRFWDKYNEWKDIESKANPDKYKGGTNPSNVEYFEEEVFDKGIRSKKKMTELAQKGYITKEEERTRVEKDNTKYDELPIGRVDAPRARSPKPNKHKAKRDEPTITQRFETINIFGEND